MSVTPLPASDVQPVLGPKAAGRRQEGQSSHPVRPCARGRHHDRLRSGSVARADRVGPQRLLQRHVQFPSTTPTSWKDRAGSGDLVFLSPILGGLVVVFLVQRFAPEAKGHGVPEVMDSVFYKRGNIRGTVAIVKAWPRHCRSAAVLRSDAKARSSRSAPRWVRRSPRRSSCRPSRRSPCSARAPGPASPRPSNTPLGGVLFAIEILLPEVSNRTFLPVVVATGAATTIGRLLIGPNPAFAVADFQFSLADSFGIEAAIGFVVLGALCGVASWAFIRLLVVMEDGFPKLPGNAYTQNIIGMAMIGAMMVALTHAFGHSYIDGVGYSVIQSILDQKMTVGGLLALLFVLKLLATTISLGCGASGGIFSPSLYLGATLGAAFAGAAATVIPNARPDRPLGRDRRHGGDGRCGNRRRHDGDRHGVRNDARLRHHRAGHRRRRGRRRHPPHADRRDHLYHQAPPPRPPDPQGPAHQSLSGQAGPRHHGAALYRRQSRDQAEGTPSLPRIPTICARSSSNATAGSSA